MNKWQKNAWISLLCVAPLWLIFGQLPISLICLEGPAFLHLFSFGCATTIGGLSWLFLLFFNKRRKRTGTAEFDERDQLILTRAALTAYIVLWLYFVSSCIFVWLAVGPERSVSVNVMPMVIVGGIVVFHSVHGVSTLIQYGRGQKD